MSDTPNGEEGSPNVGRGGSDGSNGDSQTEREPLSSDPPGTAKVIPSSGREWAIRQYHGIAPGGDPVPSDQTMSAKEIASKLGVTRRTVNRWVNEEPIPLVHDFDMRARMTLFACVVTRSREDLEKYLQLLDALDEAEYDVAVGEEEDVPIPFEKFDEQEFSPW